MLPYGLRPGVLPLHPQFKRDELLSSWLVRLARRNRVKLHTISRLLGGNQASIWNRDVDRMAAPAVISKLANLTGLESAEIREHSLAALIEQLDLDHHPNGFGTWVLPLGVWHRKRRRYGVQFCPVCFRLDDEPYIRRSWRIAYYTECERHRVLLADRCPECDAPHEYFRGEMGRRRATTAEGMNVCSRCGFDLAYTPASAAPQWPDWRVTVSIRNLHLLTGTGWAVAGEHSHHPAHSLLLVVRQFVGMMGSGRARGALYDAVAERIWPEGYDTLPARGDIYEERSILERHLLLGMAVWLLDEWPDRLLSCMYYKGLRRFELTRDMPAVPAWLEAAAQATHVLW